MCLRWQHDRPGNQITCQLTWPTIGYWYYDPKDPFNNGAKAQSYTPALNETWDWNNNRVYGVNLGGWLNTEPFISPALYEKYYPNAVDEYTLSQQMAADTAGGGLKQLEDHYATFIVSRGLGLSMSHCIQTEPFPSFRLRKISPLSLPLA